MKPLSDLEYDLILEASGPAIENDAQADPFNDSELRTLAELMDRGLVRLEPLPNGCSYPVVTPKGCVALGTHEAFLASMTR